jgi:ribonuclease T1
MRLEVLGGFRYHLRLVFQGYPVFRSGPVACRQALAKSALAIVMASGFVLSAAQSALARSDAPVLPTVELSTLPSQAQQTHRLILSGGPFPYRKDGTVFFNRERLLPLQARGWYREYTVKTPGSPDRGARRIVCGGTRPVAPETCYYTADHYASFRRIVQ